MFFDSEEDVYNDITQYYDFAEKLEEEVSKDDRVDIKDKENILIPMIEDLKSTADKLIDLYINFLKDKTNIEILDNLESTLNEVLEKVDNCRNKLYELYKDEL